MHSQHKATTRRYCARQPCRAIAVPPQNRDAPFVRLRTHDALVRIAPPPPSTYDPAAKALDRPFANYVCRVMPEEDGPAVKWQVSLDADAMRAAITRSSLRGVPFNFDAARPVILANIRYELDEGAYSEAYEVGRVGLPQMQVYTPALWLLLVTPVPETNVPPRWFPVTMNMHFLYFWYRMVLLVLTAVSHTHTLEQRIDAIRRCTWAESGASPPAAIEAFREAALESRRVMRANALAEMCKSSPVLTYETARLAGINGLDVHAAAVCELYAPLRLTTTPDGAMCFADGETPPDEQFLVEKFYSRSDWHSRAVAVMTAIRDRMCEMPRQVNDEQVRAIWRTPSSVARVLMPVEWRRKLDEYLDVYEEDCRRLEERVSPANVAASMAAEQRAAVRRLGRLEAELRVATERQNVYDKQIAHLYAQYEDKARLCFATLREHHREEPGQLSHLFEYGVRMLNVMEEMLCVVIGLPMHLRNHMRTQIIPPEASFVSANTLADCERYVRSTCEQAIKQRLLAGGTRAVTVGEEVLSPLLRTYELHQCRTAEQYNQLLFRVLDRMDTPPPPPPPPSTEPVAAQQEFADAMAVLNAAVEKYHAAERADDATAAVSSMNDAIRAHERLVEIAAQHGATTTLDDRVPLLKTLMMPPLTPVSAEVEAEWAPLFERCAEAIREWRAEPTSQEKRERIREHAERLSALVCRHPGSVLEERVRSIYRLVKESVAAAATT